MPTGGSERNQMGEGFEQKKNPRSEMDNMGSFRVACKRSGSPTCMLKNFFTKVASEGVTRGSRQDQPLGGGGERVIQLGLGPIKKPKTAASGDRAAESFVSNPKIVKKCSKPRKNRVSSQEEEKAEAGTVIRRLR